MTGNDVICFLQQRRLHMQRKEIEETIDKYLELRATYDYNLLSIQEDGNTVEIEEEEICLCGSRQ